MSELPTTGSVIEHNDVRYTLGDELGKGVFGVVYRVESSRRSVAVKVTKKTLDDDATNQQFLDEVFCLKYNNHIAVPAYITSFQQAGYGYLIMQCVEGEDLDIYVQNHQINEEELLTITETVVDALQTLYKRDPSILHYDVKPENIRIASTGAAYLLDFGSIGIGKKRRPITKTDGYSPPEQINGEDVDERGVIYALGATLFYMLSGQEPPDATLRYADSTDIRNILRAGGITEAVAQLIARMMHPDKALRYQNFAGLLVDIDKVHRQIPVTLLPNKWGLFVGIGIATIFMLSGSMIFFQALQPTAMQQITPSPLVSPVTMTTSLTLPSKTLVRPSETPTNTIVTLQETQTVGTVVMSSAETTTSTATVEVSIDLSAFDQDILFDLPSRVNGRATAGSELQLVIDGGNLEHTLIVSVPVWENGKWSWNPSSNAPALAAGDYTIFATIVDPYSGAMILSAPISFQIEKPQVVIINEKSSSYTEPNTQSSVIANFEDGMKLDAIGWTVASDEEWYYVRTKTSRQLGWLQSSYVEENLTEEDKQRLPRLP